MNIYWLLITPLLLSGLIHHLVIIKFNVWPFLAKPVDAGVIWKGKPIFGSSKTWRGFIVVIGLNSLISALMGKWWLGTITATGYCLGELPTSFIKRRLNIQPSHQVYGLKGSVLYILEQCDSILGAVLAANLVLTLTISQNAMLVIIGTSFHLLIDFGLYIFGYKKNLIKPELIKKLLSQTDLTRPG